MRRLTSLPGSRASSEPKATVPPKRRRRLRPQRRELLLAVVVLLPLLATIGAVHLLDHNAHKRMDATRLVADIERKVDEETFISWQAATSPAAAARVAGIIQELHSSIQADFADLRADGVKDESVNALFRTVSTYDDSILSADIASTHGRVDLASDQAQNILLAYLTMHGTAEQLQGALVDQQNFAAAAQEIGAAVLITAGFALCLGFFFSAQRRRRRLDLAEGEAEALRRREKSFRVLFEDAPQAMFVLDPENHTIVAVNNSAVEAYGYDRDELTEMNVADLADNPKKVVPLKAEGISHLSHKRKDGRVIEVDVRTDLLDFNGSPAILMLADDVTARNALERQLRHQAFHDLLTGLPNRELFRERVEHALARRRPADHVCAVVILDLDDFKTVNDSLGHTAGDALLMQIADRLPAFMRPGDTLSRLGGDEFGVLIEDIASPAHGVAVAERLGAALHEAFDTASGAVHISGSMGIAVAETSETCTPDMLLRNADVAMYAAKARGEGGWALFGKDMHEHVQRRLELRGALGQAVENGEMRVHYQPIVDLSTHEVTGVEALVRWQHPTRGMVPPNDFVQLAEETGKISAIGSFVLAEGARQIRRWQDALPGSRKLGLSVNASFRELIDEDFVSRTIGILEDAGLDPCQVTMEMTESMLMQDPDRAIRSLSALRDKGIRIAMDDFGTGYSSLTYLRQMPLDVVKIDRTFVMALGSEAADLSMTLAIVRLLGTLTVTTVAEGIETREQLDYVSAMGCDRGQGYLFSRPVEADKLFPLLTAQLVPAELTPA